MEFGESESNRKVITNVWDLIFLGTRVTYGITDIFRSSGPSHNKCGHNIRTRMDLSKMDVSCFIVDGDRTR
jgi:hypothetical protein